MRFPLSDGHARDLCDNGIAVVDGWDDVAKLAMWLESLGAEFSVTRQQNSATGVRSWVVGVPKIGGSWEIVRDALKPNGGSDPAPTIDTEPLYARLEAAGLLDWTAGSLFCAWARCPDSAVAIYRGDSLCPEHLEAQVLGDLDATAAALGVSGRAVGGAVDLIALVEGAKRTVHQ